MKAKTVSGHLAVTLLCLSTIANAGEASPQAESLAKAAPNTWVKVLAAKSGGRHQPIFVYAPKAGRFVIASGMQHWGGVRPRHYDTEEFDLATATWTNAYPPGMEKGRPASGPVGEAYAKQRAKHGHSGRKLFYKDGEHLRVGAGGQWHNGKVYGEYCYAPGGEKGQVYAYMWKKYTLRYDVAKRTWTDLKAPPRKTCRLWGSMCYDPINKEIFHAGGDGGSADIRTWVYSIDKNEWRSLDFGSDEFKALWGKAKELRWQAKTLLGRCASRHAVAETEEEAKVALPGEADKLAAAAAKLVAEVKAAKLEGSEKTAVEVAAGRLGKAVEAVKAVGPKLSADITPDAIGGVRTARVLFEKAVDALSPEPPGRARSQIAYDEQNKRVVLFGGDGLDRTLSDTWVYDPTTRKWEQRFPEKAPAPRAGHILRYLPKAKRIVLAGGYSRVPLAQEIWSYDTAANKWSLLTHIPLKGKRSPNCPGADARSIQFGDVNDDDVLVCPSGNTVWACKVDPTKVDDASTAERGVVSGSYTFNRISPASWEKVAPPDAAEKTRKFLDGLPANQWTAYSFPRYAPGARNRWGTTAYDTERHQLLFWGGGHATSHENDVAHFSVRGGFWTIGFHPDDPIERVYAVQPTYVSFHDRVHVPIHAYRAYCYDPTAKQMFYGNRGYDPLVREWVPKVNPGLSWRGPMHSQMEPTPQGSITYSSKGLFRFDAKAASWKKLPWTGARSPGTYCDGPGVCYDSKRDCLWITNDKAIVRYGLGDGKAEAIKLSKPKVIGRWALGGEEVFLPKDDMILMMHLFRRPDGRLCNVAWLPEENKYYWVDIAWVAGGKPAKFKRPPFSWHDAMHYDAKLDLLLINNSSAKRVWVMKFDRKTVKMEEIKP